MFCCHQLNYCCVRRSSPKSAVDDAELGASYVAVVVVVATGELVKGDRLDVPFSKQKWAYHHEWTTRMVTSASVVAVVVVAVMSAPVGVIGRGQVMQGPRFLTSSIDYDGDIGNGDRNSTPAAAWASVKRSNRSMHTERRHTDTSADEVAGLFESGGSQTEFDA